MAKTQKKRKQPVEKSMQMFQAKDFLDMIAPAAVKFNTDSYVLGGLYRCVLALRGYLEWAEKQNVQLDAQAQETLETLKFQQSQAHRAQQQGEPELGGMQL